MIPDKIKDEMTNVLSEYVTLGVIGRAFDNAGVPRNQHLKWLAEYPEYKERFEECKERFVDGLEAVAIERARDKSDSLMSLMLKSHRPEVYGDRSEVKHTGSLGNQIQLIFPEGMLNEEEKSIINGDNEDNEE